MIACLLHEALGRADECPGPSCGLWSNGCAIRDLRLDLLDREDLASYLLQLRGRLEELRPA